MNIVNQSATVADVLAAPTVCVGDTLYISDFSQGSNLMYTWDFGANATATTPASGDQEVVYSTPGLRTIELVLNGSNGSDSTSFQVNVIDLPSAQFMATPTGLQVSFASGAGAGTTVAWDFGDGVSSMQANPTHTYATTGTYPVQLITTNACGSDTSMIEVSVAPVGISDVNADNYIQVYPNPADQALHIGFAQAAGPHTIRLIDLQGKLLRETNTIVSQADTRLTWDIAELARGTYFVQVTSAQGARTFRIVKQ